MTRSSTRFAVPLLAVAAYGTKARSWMAHWGATDEEVGTTLPGDHLVQADLTTTRAITVCAPAADVWPWIVQLGQCRGGFYSYDVLENLARCDIHSADRIVPAWQSVVEGSEIKLSPEMALTVAVVEPGRALVLRGGIPMGRAPAPFDFTWAFVLTDLGDGTSRLVVRERYQYLHWWASVVVEPTSAVSFVMTRKMLLGIADRAEQSRTGAVRAS
ncbi:SRPBCC family protein [Pseudonocardia sp. GCM10023141]|uniref:SRPBCC family protein n=1 Tax=Pseudonocardia sp. GCM10023141 TaxID=3252653 RepID=UPI003611FBE7